MRHGKKFNHLGRKAAHRDAMLANMAVSLIKHKRINTTLAKAKALRKYIEPILTKSKTDDTHSRRVAFSYLQDKESITELFSTISEKIANRPGGYTRIIKTGTRLGDNAEMCMMELVDFNEFLINEEEGKVKTRRSRRGRGKSKSEKDQPAVGDEGSSVKEENVSEVEQGEISEAQENIASQEEEATMEPADEMVAEDDTEQAKSQNDDVSEKPSEDDEKK